MRSLSSRRVPTPTSGSLTPSPAVNSTTTNTTSTTAWTAGRRWSATPKAARSTCWSTPSARGAVPANPCRRAWVRFRAWWSTRRCAVTAATWAAIRSARSTRATSPSAASATPRGNASRGGCSTVRRARRSNSNCSATRTSEPRAGRATGCSATPEVRAVIFGPTAALSCTSTATTTPSGRRTRDGSATARWSSRPRRPTGTIGTTWGAWSAQTPSTSLFRPKKPAARPCNSPSSGAQATRTAISRGTSRWSGRPNTRSTAASSSLSGTPPRDAGPSCCARCPGGTR